MHTQAIWMIDSTVLFTCTAPDLQDGDVEGSPSQVEHRDQLPVRLVQAVREGCRRGFVDDAHHLQALLRVKKEKTRHTLY